MSTPNVPGVLVPVIESAKALVAAKADLNAINGDGKDALSLAIFSGSYDLAAFPIDAGSKVDQVDAQGFTPLYWAVDRRNFETAPNFRWNITKDPLYVVEKLLKAGANPNAIVNNIVNNTPRARMREGSPRIVYGTLLMRAAFSGDIELVKLLLTYGADPHIPSKDRETSWLRHWFYPGLQQGTHSCRTS